MSLYYYLSPGVSVIDAKDGNFLLTSDTLSTKLEGASAIFLVEHILPLLTGDKDLDKVCSMLKNVSVPDLQANLDQLVNAGVLRRSPIPVTGTHETAEARFFNNFLESANAATPQVSKALMDFKIALVGLEGHGTQTLLALIQAGFRNFKLVDPFPLSDDDSALFPFLKRHDGATRQSALKKYLEENIADIKVEMGPESLTKETLVDFISDCNLYIAGFDAGFIAAFYWVNEISINNSVPALYASVKGQYCYAGPFVIPGKTSCFMCYKMRNIATRQDFDEAMMYEEYLNAQKKPSLMSRSFLPGAINFLAGALSGEVIKYFFSLGQLSLPDKVLEFNTLNFETTFHHVIQKPDCPVCQKKKFERKLYTSEELAADKGSTLSELLNDLVSPHSGIIKQLEVVHKDISEPALPFVYVAQLSNHCFLPKEQHQKLSCSGKGMDVTSALVSAAGEAVERYSASVYDPGEIRYESFNRLDGNALHPEHLVLYAPDQYSSLDFSPFDPHAEIGWIRSYSLVRNKAIFLPAQSTVLNYNVRSKNEILGQSTSNGLAAGPSMIHAILSAAEEVIERDAFMIAWHNELACKRFDPATHPRRAVRELHEAYKRRGVELRLYQLPSDTPCSVFAGIGVQVEGSGPSVVVGLGCDFSQAEAARQALMEVGQIRPAFRQKLRKRETQERLQQLLADPSTVEQLEDHDLLYAVPDKLSAFDFLFKQPVTDFDWGDTREKSEKQKLDELISWCRQEKRDLIYCNLTPPDMQKMGLYTARVVITGFQPIHFGYKNIRLGGERLFDFPVKQGFFSQRKSSDALMSVYPHPLA